MSVGLSVGSGQVSLCRDNSCLGDKKLQCYLQEEKEPSPKQNDIFWYCRIASLTFDTVFQIIHDSKSQDRSSSHTV